MFKIIIGLTLLSLANEEWRDPVVPSTQDGEFVWQGKEQHERYYKVLSELFVKSKVFLYFGCVRGLFWENSRFYRAILDRRESKIYRYPK